MDAELAPACLLLHNSAPLDRHSEPLARRSHEGTADQRARQVLAILPLRDVFKPWAIPKSLRVIEGALLIVAKGRA